MSQEVHMIFIIYMSLKMSNLRLHLYLPGDNDQN